MHLALLSLLLLGQAKEEQPAPGKQVGQTLDAEVRLQVKMNYLLYLPKDYEESGSRRWPLVLFLHGAGESGNDLNKVKVHGPPKLVAAGKQFPFILVSPQSPGFGWNVPALKALLDEVEKRYRVDPERIYVTGLSMGGFGTWALAAAYPEHFAAIVPICGGGDPRQAPRLKHLAVWVFHGAKDKVVPLKRSEEMVQALKKAGGNVRFTIYPDAGHDAWTATYNNPELYTWLLEQRRTSPSK
jgi:predicted peptidase